MRLICFVGFLSAITVNVGYVLYEYVHCSIKFNHGAYDVL